MVHDNIIERVASAMITEKDVQEFGLLIGQIFEQGYKKAYQDYKEEIEKMGLKVSMISKDPS